MPPTGSSLKAQRTHRSPLCWCLLECETNSSSITSYKTFQILDIHIHTSYRVHCNPIQTHDSLTILLNVYLPSDSPRNGGARHLASGISRWPKLRKSVCWNHSLQLTCLFYLYMPFSQDQTQSGEMICSRHQEWTIFLNLQRKCGHILLVLTVDESEELI